MIGRALPMALALMAMAVAVATSCSSDDRTEAATSTLKPIETAATATDPSTSLAGVPATEPSVPSTTIAVTTTEQPTTTTIDEALRTIAVRRFVDRYESDQACRSGGLCPSGNDPPTQEEFASMAERLGAERGREAVLTFWITGVGLRINDMVNAAEEIPGSDVEPFVQAIRDSHKTYTECRYGTGPLPPPPPLEEVIAKRDECYGLETDLRRALEDLYFLVKQ